MSESVNVDAKFEIGSESVDKEYADISKESDKNMVGEVSREIVTQSEEGKCNPHGSCGNQRDVKIEPHDEKTVIEGDEDEEELENDFEGEDDKTRNVSTDQLIINQLHCDPSFAVICSFFNKFGSFLGLKPQKFDRMETMFMSYQKTGKVERDLVDLHLTLMRKLTFKSARVDTWEKYLLKYCSLVPSLHTEYLQLERYGYLHTSIATKLGILKALCESQFDYNLKFRDMLTNSFLASDLRLLPLGFDQGGLAYWYQQDVDLVVRVYSAEQDDESGGSWNLVAKSKEELENLVAKLRALSKLVSTAAAKVEEKKLPSQMKEENASSVLLSQFVTKHGALLDTFQDETTLKKKVKKEVRKAKVERELEGKKEADESCIVAVEDIPDDVKPFIDRRVLPRRSARSAAISHMRIITTHQTPTKTGRPRGRPPKNKNSDCIISTDLKSNRSLKNEVAQNVDGDDDGNNNDDDNSEIQDDDGDKSADFFSSEESSTDTCSDGEFMPPTEHKKRVIGRKGRGSKKRKKILEEFDEIEDDSFDESDDEGKNIRKERKKATEETKCMKCKKSSNPEVLLLCDICDDAWHTWCLRPMLWFVPDDDWFCPNCHHHMLINKFTSLLDVLDERHKQKATEDKKKEAAAERLKREMEYIGVSINNIIPVGMEEQSSETSEEFDVDDGERKSKRKAMKRMGHRPSKPIVPIALSRTRRHVAKVDYNFEAYDDLIQEAVESIDETAIKTKNSNDSVRPQGGAGRGKDMSNIINAERKRISSIGNGDENTVERNQQKVKKAAKGRHKLNDLNVDDLTDVMSEVSDPSDDTEEYIPSDEDRRRQTKRRSSGRRTRSDDEFVVSGSESDYVPSKKRRKEPTRGKKTKSKRRRGWHSSDDDSTSEVNDYESDESSDGKNSRKKITNSKWAPRESSSDDDSDSCVGKTTAGRPLRRVVEKKKSFTEDDDEEEEESEENETKKAKEQRPVGTGRSISSDEFEPDEEEDEDEVDEEGSDENVENEDDGDKKSAADNEISEKGSKNLKKENESLSIASNPDPISEEIQQPRNVDTDIKSATDDAKVSLSTAKVDQSDKQTELDPDIRKSALVPEIMVSKTDKNEPVILHGRLPIPSATGTLPTSIQAQSSNQAASLGLLPVNPASVMEQMARLAAPTAQIPLIASPITGNYHVPIHPTPGLVIGNPYNMVPPHPFIDSSNPYGIRSQQNFVRPDLQNFQSAIGTIPPSWQYTTAQNTTPVLSVPAITVPVTAPSQPTTDADSLSNALASAMDC